MKWAKDSTTVIDTFWDIIVSVEEIEDKALEEQEVPEFERAVNVWIIMSLAL